MQDATGWYSSEKGVFNRCDGIPSLSLLTLLWYSIATGRVPIRKKGFLIHAIAYQLQALLRFHGTQLQLAGVLFGKRGF
jgi:hypothetical protein